MFCTLKSIILDLLVLLPYSTTQELHRFGANIFRACLRGNREKNSNVGMRWGFVCVFCFVLAEESSCPPL